MSYTATMSMGPSSVVLKKLYIFFALLILQVVSFVPWLPKHKRHFGPFFTTLDQQIETWDKADWKRALNSQPKQVFKPLQLKIVSGTIPNTLPHGIVYKAGPANFERGSQKYKHWLEGDGSVFRLELGPGPLDCKFQSRFVETELFLKEKGANKVLSRGTFGTKPQQDWKYLLDLTLKNPCNTNALRMGSNGPLLALSEVGLPYRLDPDTLETLGPETFDNKLRQGSPAATLGDRLSFMEGWIGFGDAVAAHYRVDDNRIVLVRMRQHALSKDTHLSLLQFDKVSGELLGDNHSAILSETGFPPHDWALTERYAVFLSCPAGGDLTPFLLGSKGPAECIRFEKDAKASVHIVDRSSRSQHHPGRRAETKRIELPRSIHPIHFANAWETTTKDEDDGNSVSLEIIASCWDSDTIEKMMETKGSLLGSWESVSEGVFDGVPIQKLLRISVGGMKEVSIETILPGHFDYCKCHPNLTGKESMFVWGTKAARIEETKFQKKETPSPGQLICCVCLESNSQIDEWYCGARRFLDDFIIIPKQGKGNIISPESERQVWVIAPCFNSESNTTSFVILDGSDLGLGPVFEAKLDHHVPWGLHGSWFPLQ